MQISPVSDQSIPNIWDLKELPERPLMSKDSIWTKGLQQLCPNANPEELCKGAYYLMENTLTVVRRAIARESKIHRETAQKWKDAIFGR